MFHIGSVMKFKYTISFTGSTWALTSVINWWYDGHQYFVYIGIAAFGYCDEVSEKMSWEYFYSFQVVIANKSRLLILGTINKSRR